MNVQDFYYNGKSLSEFGMMMINTDSIEDGSFSLAREIIQTNLSTHSNTIKILSTKYTDTLQFQICIIKDVCMFKKQFERVLHRTEQHELTKWLTGTTTPTLFQPFDYPYKFEEAIEYFCVVTDITPFLVGKEIYGMYVTFKCNAPYGYTPLSTENYDLSTNFVDNLLFYCDSGELTQLYLPQEVRLHTGNNVYTVINNTTVGKQLKIKTDANSDYIISPHRKAIYKVDNSGNKKLLTLHDVGIELNTNIFNINSIGSPIYWLGFADGDNLLETTNISHLEIDYRFPRKVGVF